MDQDPLPNAGRVAGLDLLRALAILMVLASHWAGHFGYWFDVKIPPIADTLGDVGVEVFFALSGFLIGRILICMTRTRPSWRDFGGFLRRRATRTLPLYFLWLALILVVFPPAQNVAVTGLRYASFTQNLISPFPTDYYFAVSWSLSIEVWFYALFSLAVVVLARWFGGKFALDGCLAIALIGPLLLRLATLERGSQVFFRIDEIAYGVLTARLYLAGHPLFCHSTKALAAGITLIALALADWLPLPHALVVPLTSNAEIIGAALCLPAALRLGSGPVWFAGPVQWIAGRSYALYLMHLTILVDLAEQRLFEPMALPASACVAVAILLPFPMAELSYRLIEAPLLRRRHHLIPAAQPTRPEMASWAGV